MTYEMNFFLIFICFVLILLRSCSYKRRALSIF